MILARLSAFGARVLLPSRPARADYIFASVWGHKVYTIYSILFIVFIILVIVTAFITIALTYCQLAGEDHRWWWRSVACGGSTALFIYGAPRCALRFAVVSLLHWRS